VRVSTALRERTPSPATYSSKTYSDILEGTTVRSAGWNEPCRDGSSDLAGVLLCPPSHLRDLVRVTRLVLDQVVDDPLRRVFVIGANGSAEAPPLVEGHALQLGQEPRARALQPREMPFQRDPGHRCQTSVRKSMIPRELR